ncbi:MAG: hypothetical protein ACP5GJ_03330 [Nanopusillaceae archaeon]
MVDTDNNIYNIRSYNNLDEILKEKESKELDPKENISLEIYGISLLLLETDKNLNVKKISLELPIETSSYVDLPFLTYINNYNNLKEAFSSKEEKRIVIKPKIIERSQYGLLFYDLTSRRALGVKDFFIYQNKKLFSIYGEVMIVDTYGENRLESRTIRNGENLDEKVGSYLLNYCIKMDSSEQNDNISINNFEEGIGEKTFIATINRIIPCLETEDRYLFLIGSYDVPNVGGRGIIIMENFYDFVLGLPQEIAKKYHVSRWLK